MPRRPTATLVRWAAVACLLAAGGAVAALTWPWTAGAAARHLNKTASFSDHNGVIVYERQPSGLLGTVRPDGSGDKPAGQLGQLQGVDVPVASPDGRYLVTDEAQVVTLGPAGPASIAFMPLAAQLQQNFGNWIEPSFADGGKFVVAAECGGSVGAQWQVRIMPTSSGAAGWLLGGVNATDDASGVAGDPQSAGAFVVPGSGECGASTPQSVPSHGDSGVLFERPGHAQRTVVTASALKQALGAAAATPVLLDVHPSPDGNLLAVAVSSFRVESGPYGPYPFGTVLGVVLVTRTGQVAGKLAGSFGYQLRWSADGKRIAGISQAGTSLKPGRWQIQIWPLAGRPAQITLSGHDSESLTQLLWSPDGTQLACAFQKNGYGTESQLLTPGWTVVDVRTGQAHDVTAPGQPAAWLPGTRTR